MCRTCNEGQKNLRYPTVHTVCWMHSTARLLLCARSGPWPVVLSNGEHFRLFTESMHHLGAAATATTTATATAAAAAAAHMP